MPTYSRVHESKHDDTANQHCEALGTHAGLEQLQYLRQQVERLGQQLDNGRQDRQPDRERVVWHCELELRRRGHEHAADHRCHDGAHRHHQPHDVHLPLRPVLLLLFGVSGKRHDASWTCSPEALSCQKQNKRQHELQLQRRDLCTVITTRASACERGASAIAIVVALLAARTPKTDGSSHRTTATFKQNVSTRETTCKPD